VKPKRTSHDVLQHLHTVIRLAQAHPALVDKAMHSMTPEQLRKAHEGLAVLINCIGPVPVAPAATPSPVADKAPPSRTPASVAAPGSAPAATSHQARQQPAIESS